MSSTSDAWLNLEARRLLSDLADRGIVVTVRAGTLDVRPASHLRPDEPARLRQHKPDLLVLVLACTDAVLDRLLEMRAGRLGRAITTTPGRCHVCADHLPADREHGRCGPCALAARLYAGAPLTTDVLRLYPADVRGPMPVTPLSGQALPFDEQVPA